MVRSPGYLALCVVVLLVFLTIAVSAHLDPEGGNASSDWMLWIVTALLVALLARAPFVGLLIDDERVVRRGWFWSTSRPRANVVSVGTVSYSGLLNGGSRSHLFRMLLLRLSGGKTLEVPVVSARPETVAKICDRIIAATGWRLSRSWRVDPRGS